MPKFYREIDFFILSSKTEGFPNVLAEAGGAGCITFSTDVGDASKIINNEDRIVSVGDAAALTKILFRYLNKSGEELKEIAFCSAEFIRDTYSLKTVSDALSVI